MLVNSTVLNLALWWRFSLFCLKNEAKQLVARNIYCQTFYAHFSFSTTILRRHWPNMCSLSTAHAIIVLSVYLFQANEITLNAPNGRNFKVRLSNAIEFLHHFSSNVNNFSASVSIKIPPFRTYYWRCYHISCTLFQFHIVFGREFVICSRKRNAKCVVRAQRNQ